MLRDRLRRITVVLLPFGELAVSSPAPATATTATTAASSAFTSLLRRTLALRTRRRFLVIGLLRLRRGIVRGLLTVLDVLVEAIKPFFLELVFPPLTRRKLARLFRPAAPVVAPAASALLERLRLGAKLRGVRRLGDHSQLLQEHQSLAVVEQVDPHFV